jgi:hypothetical protein
MAERVGFEPTLEFPLNTLSKRAPSATRPSLRHYCPERILWARDGGSKWHLALGNWHSALDRTNAQAQFSKTKC